MHKNTPPLSRVDFPWLSAKTSQGHFETRNTAGQQHRRTKVRKELIHLRSQRYFMGILRKLFPSLLIVFSLPSFAGVIVYSPANGADVSPGFSLSAFANWCGDQSVTTVGYSLDGSTSTA